MRRLAVADFTRSRWKNWQGETIQIAVAPPGAGLHDFVWRVSMATIAEDGPFSCFAGIERSLVVLSGHGLRLHRRDGVVTLRPGDAPYRFAGDEPLRASLLDGPVRDFNVMTRRVSASHELVPVEHGHTRLVGADTTTLLFALDAMTLTVAKEPLGLDADEALRLDPGEELKVDSGRGLAATIHHRE